MGTVNNCNSASNVVFILSKHPRGDEAMRINVYSQELTGEVQTVAKKSNTGVTYHAAMLVLHSSPFLHHPPSDDDRSAVMFWLPKSKARREQMARAFEHIATIFRSAPDSGLD